jgi:hypothetical protein
VPENRIKSGRTPGRANLASVAVLASARRRYLHVMQHPFEIEPGPQGVKVGVFFQFGDVLVAVRDGLPPGVVRDVPTTSGLRSKKATVGNEPGRATGGTGGNNDLPSPTPVPMPRP